MRPIKDLFIEEYWNIAFRNYTEEDSVVSGENKKTKFDVLKANKRFWYADPFLFEKDGKTYLFVEMFDNKTEVGVIGCSEFINGKFTEPEVVLEESFHLSYPYVFEKDGKILMMPETHEDGCIQFYEAVEFPKKWKKLSVAVNDVNVVDTVIENGMFIGSAICPENDMSIDICVYDKDGNKMPYSPVYKRCLDRRGAGMCFSFKNERIRPAQSCENGLYGGKIIFYKINQCDKERYSEEKFSEITPAMIEVNGLENVSGIHTYARTGKIEIVDAKSERINFKRLFWIIKRKV